MEPQRFLFFISDVASWLTLNRYGNPRTKLNISVDPSRFLPIHSIANGKTFSDILANTCRSPLPLGKWVVRIFSLAISISSSFLFRSNNDAYSSNVSRSKYRSPQIVANVWFDEYVCLMLVLSQSIWQRAVAFLLETNSSVLPCAFNAMNEEFLANADKIATNPSSPISHYFAVRYCNLDIGLLRHLENPSQPADVIESLPLTCNCCSNYWLPKHPPRVSCLHHRFQCYWCSIFPMSTRDEIGWTRGNSR